MQMGHIHASLNITKDRHQLEALGITTGALTGTRIMMSPGNASLAPAKSVKTALITLVERLAQC